MACSRVVEIALDLRIFLRAGHGQQVRISRLAARQRRTRSTTRRSESSSVLLVVARAVRPSKTVRTETVSVCSATFWWMVLLAKRVSASVAAPISTSVSSASENLKISARRRSSASEADADRRQPRRFGPGDVLRAWRILFCGSRIPFGCTGFSWWVGRGLASLDHTGLAAPQRHFANATPTLMLRKRAGDAPWPVPMVCMGWPLPQFGVPHSVQWSREQMASQLFQNSVVMPL